MENIILLISIHSSKIQNIKNKKEKKEIDQKQGLTKLQGKYEVQQTLFHSGQKNFSDNK